MGIEIISKQINSGDSGTFNFKHNVIDCVAGINGFQLHYASDNENVGKLGISLSTSFNEKVVTVTPTLTLSDEDGDSGSGYVTVIVVAWTGSANSNIILGSGQAGSGSVATGGMTVSASKALLAGFSAGFTSADDITSIDVQTGINVDAIDHVIKFTGSNVLTGEEPQSASPTIEVGCIATSELDLGFSMQSLTLDCGAAAEGSPDDPTHGVLATKSKTLTFDKAIAKDSAFTIITGFNLAFNDDYEMAEMSVSSSATISTSDATSVTVTLGGGMWRLESWPCDDEQSQTNNITAVVIGIHDAS